MPAEYRISYPLAGAAVAAVAVQAASNAMFVHELGAIPWREIWGVPLTVDGVALACGSVAVAVGQASFATAAMHAPKGDRWRAAYASLALTCAVFSIGSAASHLLKLQRLDADKAAAARKLHEGAKAARDRAAATRDAALGTVSRLESELAGLAAVRPARVIRAEIDAVPIKTTDARDSKGCTAFPYEGLRATCEPVLKLRREEGQAARKVELEGELRAATEAVAKSNAELAPLEAVLAVTPPPVEPTPAEAAVRHGLPWVFAVALELLGTFGFPLATRRAKSATPPAAPAPVAPAPRARAPRPAKVNGLHELLAKLAEGTATATGCSITPDGWVDASQRALADAIGLTAPTVNRQLKGLEEAGRVRRRQVGATIQWQVT